MGLLDIGTIEGRAQYVRKHCGLEGLDPPYSTNVITDRFFSKVAITGDHLPNGITEMVVADKGRFSLFYSRKVGTPSQRLGILHGCYHVMTDLAGADGIRECNLTERKFRQRSPELENPIEVSCDLFAGALLVPFIVLDKLAPASLFPKDPVKLQVFKDEVDRLASVFKVPSGFINWRLWDLMMLRKTNFWMAGESSI